ncbi:serine/threonine-protein kinase 33-like [Thalassophryne amazonica]|uniref:serine/threonine-protein kinase 33-like n=1 Tax=Thalassophryne amazonica TaxID=390379 RepID=UPI0014711366|nr:serine/threonine-protein kinase 33-like [Thalassophryne amazonica]
MIDIKVSDFGLSEKMGGTGIENMLSGTRGTLMYMAPEKMKEQPFSKQCDLWSIGVIMYMLLCGEPPYRSTQKEPLLKEISEQKVKFTHSIWNTVSDEAKNILTSLLKEDPGDRLSAGQLLDSPWITGENRMLAMQPNSVVMMNQELFYLSIFCLL